MPGEHMRGPLRAVRGLVLGACVLVISVAGHTAGGQGSLPDVMSFLILLPLAISLSVAMTGRRRGVVWLLAYLVGVQALFHVLLTLTTSHVGHHQAFIPTLTMLTLHLLATFACAAVLTTGDAHLVSWLRFLAGLGRTFAAPLVAPPWVPLTVPALVGAPPVRRVATQPWQHRGPPVLSF